MAKPRWQHKYPFNFPNFRAFKLRISFKLDFFFLLEFFQLIALYFCAGDLYYRMKIIFIYWKGGEILTEHHMSFRPKGETKFK